MGNTTPYMSPELTLKGESGPRGVGFSTDGTVLAVTECNPVSKLSAVRFWATSAGKGEAASPDCLVAGVDQVANEVAWRPGDGAAAEGAVVAVGCADGTVHLIKYSASTAEVYQEAAVEGSNSDASAASTPKRGAVTSSLVTWSPDGSMLAAYKQASSPSSDNTVRILKRSSGDSDKYTAAGSQVIDQDVECMTWMPHGSTWQLVVGTASGSATKVEAKIQSLCVNTSPVGTLVVPLWLTRVTAERVRSIAWNGKLGDDAAIAVALEMPRDKAPLRVLDGAGKKVKDLPVTGINTLYSVAWSPDGSRIAAGEGGAKSTGKVWMFDGTSYAPITSTANVGKHDRLDVSALEFAANSLLLVAAPRQRGVWFLDAKKGNKVAKNKENALPTEPRTIAWSCLGQLACCGGGVDVNTYIFSHKLSKQGAKVPEPLVAAAATAPSSTASASDGEQGDAAGGAGAGAGAGAPGAAAASVSSKAAAPKKAPLTREGAAVKIQAVLRGGHTRAALNALERKLAASEGS